MNRQTVALLGCAVFLVFLNVKWANASVVYYTEKAAFDAATTSQLVEDFEAVSADTPQYPGFTHNGNTFTGLAGDPAPNVLVVSPSTDAFQVPNSSHVLTANGLENIRIDFGTQTTAVGFDTYLNGEGPAEISLYDFSGLFGPPYEHNHAAGQVGFFGVITDWPIHAIRWETPNGDLPSKNTGIDNIFQNIPEPSALFLTVSCLLGSLAWGWRKRKRYQL